METSPYASHGIYISNNELGRMDDERVVEKYNKEEIIEIKVKYGFQAEKPLVELVLGALMLCVGYFPIKYIINWIKEGGVLWDIQVFIILLFPLGAWLVYDALKKSNYILVSTKNIRRKIPLKKIENDDLQQIQNILCELKYIK